MSTSACPRAHRSPNTTGRRRRAGVLGAVLTVLVPTTAWAQAAGGDAPARSEVQPVGVYGGVDPDGASGPVVRGHRRGKHPQALWIGFHPREGGGARLFVQLDRAVEVSQSIANGKLIVSLPGAVARDANTIRALDTRFFKSTVARVEPSRSRRGRGLTLTIAFKAGVTAAQVSATPTRGKDGMTYLAFDFPAGPAAAEPPAGGAGRTTPGGAVDLDVESGNAEGEAP